MFVKKNVCVQYHNYTTIPMAQFASSLHLGIVHCLNHAVRNPADITIRGVQGRSSDSFQQSNTFPPNATVAFLLAVIRNLQQRVLLPVCTAFPFNRRHTL